MSRRRPVLDLPKRELYSTASVAGASTNEGDLPLPQSTFRPNQPATPNAPHKHINQTSVTQNGLGGLLAYSDSDSEEEDSTAANTQPQLPPTTNTSVHQNDTNTSNIDATSTDTSNEQNELPHGWSACVEDGTGDTYYWNQLTDETSWERPTLKSTIVNETTKNDVTTSQLLNSNLSVSTNILPSPSSSTTAAASSPPPLPAGWVSVVDPDSSDVYYWHEDTDRTTWERPTEEGKEEETKKQQNENENKDQQASDTTQIVNETTTHPKSTPSIPAAVTPAASIPLTSSANSLFIEALLAGLHARIRDGLDSPALPPLTGSTTVKESISPLMRISVQIEWVEAQWNAPHTTQAEIDARATNVLQQLQQLTIDVDSSLASESAWRAVRGRPVIAPAPVATPTISPPPVSGFVHPSRIGVVAHASADASTSKRARSPSPSDASHKKLKSHKAPSAPPPRMSKEIGGLLSKWRAVEEETAAERAQAKLEKMNPRGEDWRTSRNPNLTPIGDTKR